MNTAQQQEQDKTMMKKRTEGMKETKTLESIQHVGVAEVDNDFLLTPEQVWEMFYSPKTVDESLVFYNPHLPNINTLKRGLAKLIGAVEGRSMPIQSVVVTSVVCTGRFMFVDYTPYGVSRAYATGDYPIQQTYTPPASTELPNRFTASCAPLPKGVPSTWGAQADPFGGTNDQNEYPEYVPQYIPPYIEHYDTGIDPPILLASEDSQAADRLNIQSYLFTQTWVRMRIGLKHMRYEQDSRVPAGWYEATVQASRALVEPLIAMNPTYLEAAYFFSTLQDGIASVFGKEYL